MSRLSVLGEGEASVGTKVCYVCGGKILGEVVGVGRGLDRHVRCAPGTVRWCMATPRVTQKDRDWHRLFGCCGGRS